jgi:hypothetical protein
MVLDYKKQCIKAIKKYINKNKVYECYEFLLQNLDFVNNSSQKFKDATISKAYDLIEQCDDKINNTDSENFKVKCVNIRTILTEYLSHFNF